MADLKPEQIFVTGSHTFEITGNNMARKLDRGKCIQSERFTVGGCDWVIEFYPKGHQNAPHNDDYASVYVKLLSTSEQVDAMYSFYMWHWNDQKWYQYWIMSPTSELTPFSPSGNFRSWGAPTIKLSELNNYVRDDAFKIKCSLCVAAAKVSST